MTVEPTAPTPTRREVATRRVEYRLLLGLAGADYRRVVEALDAVIRNRPDAASPVRVRTDADAVLVWYELTPFADGWDAVAHRTDLRDALNYPGDGIPSWDRLLDVVRARTRLADVVASTNLRGTGDDPVPALLPRDWRRELDALLPDAGNRMGMLTLVKRVVSDWTLAARDARERLYPGGDQR